MNNTTLGIPNDFYPWLISLLMHTGGYFVLAFALLRWWQRTRHWSVLVLACSFLLTSGITGLVLVVRSQPAPSDWDAALDNIKVIVDLARTTLLCIGAVGLMIASRCSHWPSATNGASPASPLESAPVFKS